MQPGDVAVAVLLSLITANAWLPVGGGRGGVVVAVEARIRGAEGPGGDSGVVAAAARTRVAARSRVAEGAGGDGGVVVVTFRERLAAVPGGGGRDARVTNLEANPTHPGRPGQTFGGAFAGSE
jgi:hypothetical protein